MKKIEPELKAGDLVTFTQVPGGKSIFKEEIHHCQVLKVGAKKSRVQIMSSVNRGATLWIETSTLSKVPVPPKTD